MPTTFVSTTVNPPLSSTFQNSIKQEINTDNGLQITKQAKSQKSRGDESLNDANERLKFMSSQKQKTST